MSLARTILLILLLAQRSAGAYADTVVERRQACADRTHLAEILWLSASKRQAQATQLFEAGVHHRRCRFLEVGEIVAVLAVDGLVRILSFATGDRLWAHREAIARCSSEPDWLPEPAHAALARKRSHHAAIWDCHPNATKWRPLDDHSPQIADQAADTEE